MKKILFIGRDGTIIDDSEGKQIDSFKKLQFLPGVISNLHKIATELDFELVMVTSQNGLGTASFPEEKFWPVQNKIIDILGGEGIVFEEVFIEQTLPQDDLQRKEKLAKYLYGTYDLQKSYVIGSQKSDMRLAEMIGCRSIFVGPVNRGEADLTTIDWTEIYRFLKGGSASASVKRKTRETDIAVKLDLNGTGRSTISTGLPFFDHMLEQIARHGDVDLEINATGDLQVDEHHTIEDVAIVLGQAFKQALGSKKGIERYGFLLPMDDCLAQVAVDFGGRPWLEWNAEFKRERIGDMPTEMFEHFFKSFSDHAKCNLNVKAEGTNDHHKIESIFKGFAKAVKMAVRKTTNTKVPSTKGSL